MNPEISNLIPFLLVPALAALLCFLLIAALGFVLYFFFFKAMITTWFEEKARYQTQGLTEEQVIQIVREEIRDYLIRHPRS